MHPTIKQKIDSLPEAPGSYQMLDENNRIIYVGKAKNLRSRVRSYFTGSHDQKTQSLVANIRDFTYIVTASELEAFLLELSLIKEHSPRYNIMLMDDKTYPHIAITDETHPRLLITRSIDQKNINIFGPFPDARSARETLALLNRVYPFRKCDVMPKKYCLYYHIGQCLGPCENDVAPQTYQPMIEGVRKLLQGHIKELIEDLTRKMQEASDQWVYEKAKEYRDTIDAVQKTVLKQSVIFQDAGDRDIIAYHTYDHYMAISILFMRQGRILFSENQVVTYYQDPISAFLDYVAQFYDHHSLPKEVLLPSSAPLDLIGPLLNDRARSPQKGKKAELVKLAHDNARIHLEANLSTYLKQHDKTIGAIVKLGEILNIPTPERIEAFDNSNLFGEAAVSAMVVFSQGLPEKKGYRKYKVKSITQPDDYHTMQEVVYRRYQRLLVEGGKMPDLIITDGGRTQYQATKEVIDQLYLEIPVIGLKKDEHHRTHAIVTETDEWIIDRHDMLYLLLNKIQEEAHRFAISFHRNLQSKKIYASILNAIPSIGSKTKMKLLQQFKTIENIVSATDEELKQLGLNQKQIENLRIALVKT
ncbi:MAG: excinuclease ABC subunit UvrC [Candidatus Izemoplasmatales bacterium]|nr:excinuclease ABC subunit UvrC [Candidatus Izemoplasmatales bacterium]